MYADDPYDETPECVAESPNESPSDYAISGGFAHEHSDSLTTPNSTRGTAKRKFEEIADKCRSANAEKELGPPLGTAADGAPYNQLINGHEYLYQQDVEQRTRRLRAARGAPPDGQETGPEDRPRGRRHRASRSPARASRGAVTVYFGATPGTDAKVAGPTSSRCPVARPAAPAKSSKSGGPHRN